MKSLRSVLKEVLITEDKGLPTIINSSAVEYVFDKKISGKIKKQLDKSVWKFIESQNQIDVEKVTYGKYSVIIEPMLHKPWPTENQKGAFGKGLNILISPLVIKSIKDLNGSIKIFFHKKINPSLFKGGKVPKQIQDFVHTQNYFKVDDVSYDKKDNSITVVPKENVSGISKTYINNFSNYLRDYLAINDDVYVPLMQ